MAKVILLCEDIIGKAMAGTAIRYWELSKALSKQHDVVLVAPNQPDISSEDFQIKTHKGPYAPLFVDADVVITQKITMEVVWGAKQTGAKIILDAYAPEPLEHLEIFKHESISKRNADNDYITNHYLFSFLYADAIICANTRQRDLWTGLLLALKKINPALYDRDPTLQQTIEIVPFGLPSTPPTFSGEGLRQRFNLKPTDKVVLWGGGVWNWFDSLSVVKAIHKLSLERSDIHLVFMGLKHPNENIPEMEMCRQTIDLAKELGLIDKHVFFNYGWTPYEQRQSFLLESDIGISSHFDHLETQYAFRTRILDYIWARLPIVATEGDCFAKEIEAHGLGATVPYQDPIAIAEAIKSIVDNPEAAKQMKKNLHTLSAKYQWDHIAHSLNSVIESVIKAPSSKVTRFTRWKIFLDFAKNHSPRFVLQKIYYRVKGKFVYG